MPSQRMPLRKDPTLGGKGVKLPEKIIFSLPPLIICRSLFSSLLQNVELQLAEEAMQGGESCRLGGGRQSCKEGGHGLGCDCLNKLH